MWASSVSRRFAGQDGPACHAAAQSLSLSRQVAKASSTRSGKEQSTGRKPAKEISTQEAGDGWIPGGKLAGGVVGTLLSGGADGGVLLEIRGAGRRRWQMTKRGKSQRHSTTSPSLSPQTWGHYQDAQRQQQACDLACPSR